jgi:hypothetical protein
MPKKRSDWDFLPSPEEIGKYVHEWIAVIDKKVVAHGKDLKPVYAKALKIQEKKNKGTVSVPPEVPFFMWVPGGEEYVL